jgi:hypothetical protein
MVEQNRQRAIAKILTKNRKQQNFVPKLAFNIFYILPARMNNCMTTNWMLMLNIFSKP